MFCAAGLVCLELYKVVQGKPLEAFRNMYANLALPLFAASEPAPPKVFRFNGMEWSLWDRWILEGDLTVQQVLDWFKARPLLPLAGPELQPLPQRCPGGWLLPCFATDHGKAMLIFKDWFNRGGASVHERRWCGGRSAAWRRTACRAGRA